MTPPISPPSPRFGSVPFTNRISKYYAGSSEYVSPEDSGLSPRVSYPNNTRSGRSAQAHANPFNRTLRGLLGAVAGYYAASTVSDSKLTRLTGAVIGYFLGTYGLDSLSKSAKPGTDLNGGK